MRHSYQILPHKPNQNDHLESSHSHRKLIEILQEFLVNIYRDYYRFLHKIHIHCLEKILHYADYLVDQIPVEYHQY